MPDFSIENRYGDFTVFGCDEAGRGPLVGPVVAACVHIPHYKYESPVWAMVNDSKKLSHKKREGLFTLIQSHCIWGIGEASPQEIEDINILHASFLAMARAFDMALSSLQKQEGFSTAREPCFRREDNGGMIALIDGNRKPKSFPCPAVPIVRGDAHSVSIAAASILAKVTRDRMMKELAQEHPHYGWDKNAGYPTPVHLSAIVQHGITPHHRRSYAPVKKALDSLSTLP